LLPSAKIDRDFFNAVISSATLEVSTPWNSPMTDLLLCLEVVIRRLWSFGGEHPIAVHYQMKTKHESSVNSVVVSSDNSRIISGGADSKVFIHDART